MVVRMDSHVLVRNMYILYVDHVVLVYLLLLHVQIVKYIQIYVLDQDVINLNYLNFDLYEKFENVLDDIFLKKNWRKGQLKKYQYYSDRPPKKHISYGDVSNHYLSRGHYVKMIANAEIYHQRRCWHDPPLLGLIFVNDDQSVDSEHHKHHLLFHQI